MQYNHTVFSAEGTLSQDGVIMSQFHPSSRRSEVSHLPSFDLLPLPSYPKLMPTLDVYT
jgi:hypothetical protein